MSNIEKIRKEIERRIKSCKTKNGFPAGTISAIRIETYEGLLAFIDSLQQEQPSLPNNLDEAAEKKYPVYWKNYPKDGIARSELSYDTNKQCRDAFKAGVKWMAEQGYTTETRVDRTPMNGPIGICLHLHDSTGFKIDDKVIVQIRKK